MRQLLPPPPDPRADADPYSLYRTDAPGVVRINMVASADGVVVDADGSSGTIGGVGDRTVFRTLRALADVIVVGAATVRAEGYGPHRVTAELADRRAADGRTKPAAMAVVSRSLDLDWTAPLFTSAVTPTIVLTCAAADATRRRAAETAVDVVEVGGEAVEPARALAALRERGMASVLVEGGPSLNTAWFAAAVVDELCLTVSPALLGGAGPRLAGDLAHRIDLSLLTALVDDDELYLRYEVIR
jgi:riboflavin biosynthesis pyrimidine reductase